MAPKPVGYRDVPQRIAEWREKHPEGSLQQFELQFVDVAGQSYVVYTAAAYRTPDDPRPGMGTAWEPIPGTSQFTKDSEVQNAETSAWGRAIIAAGASDASRIATREDVENRTGEKMGVTSRQMLDTLLAEDSGFTPAQNGEIIAAAIGRRMKNTAELSNEEVAIAYQAVTAAILDREQLAKGGQP